jgi:hypothetical protein
MVTFNFRDPKFTKHIIVNPENSIALGILNVVAVIRGLPVAGSTSGETFDMEFALRSIGLRMTAAGNFQVKFNQHLRTKPLIVDGNPVKDELTGRTKRVPALDKDGKQVWDEDFCPITATTRTAFTSYCTTVPGLPEALAEAKVALAAKQGAAAPAPSEDAGAAAEGNFSV